jgi:serine/threonine-protein kinase
MPDLRDRLQLSLGHAYIIERELGGGGMSRVFVANETSLSRPVVVKVLAPELAAGVSAERFQREIKVAAALQHPNIVPVHAAGAAGELPYYTMPFVDGLSLRERLERGDALPIAEILRILKDVARALAYAHERGVVHRDIKPENVLLAHDAAVVTDFGIAKAIAASRSNGPESGTDPKLDTLTQIGTSLGTPAYMSPEQAAGDPATDHRADIYSFGCMAYELLAGHPPFAGKLPHQLFLAHATESPPDIRSARPDCPPPLAALVMRCLEKDPAHRPQSARDIQHALESGTTPVTVNAPLPAKRNVMLIAAAAAVLVATLAFVAMSRPRSTTADKHSVAVLPFDNEAGDTANAYFGEGIAEELITGLSKVPGLRVAGRSSSFRFRGKSADVRDAAHTLNVASLLEGSVRRSGSRMRVTAQLTNASDGVVLWSDTYVRDIKDAFAVQDEITRAIVGALQVRLATGTRATTAPAREVNPEAYDLYLRGLAEFRQRGKHVQTSIGYFEQAIARDSMFARAYAQLATALAMQPLYAPVTFDSLRARTFAASERAVALEPQSGEAHTALATAYNFSTSEYTKSISEFERSIALEPTYSATHYLMSVVLTGTGEYDRGIAEGRRAVELDPVSAVSRFVLGRGELQARMYEESAAESRRAIQLDSTFPLAPAILAAAEFFLGHPDIARQLALRALPAPISGPYLSYVLSATGNAASRAALLHVLEAKRGGNSFGETSLATAYLGAGDTSRALDALDRAAARKEPIAAGTGFGSPMYDQIRASPRFTALIRGYGADPSMVNRVMQRRAR